VTPLLPLSVLIPAGWTAEQAIAVLEFLNELRDALWTLHGERIQQYLQQQQAAANPNAPDSGSDGADPAF